MAQHWLWCFSAVEDWIIRSYKTLMGFQQGRYIRGEVGRLGHCAVVRSLQLLVLPPPSQRGLQSRQLPNKQLSGHNVSRFGFWFTLPGTLNHAADHKYEREPLHCWSFCLYQEQRPLECFSIMTLSTAIQQWLCCIYATMRCKCVSYFYYYLFLNATTVRPHFPSFE